MTKRREVLLAVSTVAITVAVCLLAPEVVLRFLPVASGMRAVEVTAQRPVFHFTPNRDFVMRWLELKSILFGAPAMAAHAATGKSAVAARDEQRVRDSIAAVDAFFRDLPEYTGLPPARILFTVEGFRYPDQAAASARSYLDRVRRALLEKAGALGYDTIDLDPPFFEHYNRTSERVEFPRDGHWNGTYHRVAFEAVMASPFMTRILAESLAVGSNQR